MLGIFLAAALSLGGDAHQAAAHRSQYAPEDHYLHYYSSLEVAPPELRADVEAALKFTVSSASRQRLVEYHVPDRIWWKEDGALHRTEVFHLDLYGLKWDAKDFTEVLRTYPYRTYQTKYQNPLVIHPGWLIQEIADQKRSKSNAYLLLLYGRANVPKNRDEYLKFWDIAKQSEFNFGWIEGKSGVSNVKKRWLESHPILQPEGYAWGTKDADPELFDAGADPSEHPDGDFKHQAEEWIASILKQSYKTGEKGALQSYLLSTDKGALQDFAPAGIVNDKHEWRGTPEIRNFGSCIGCHTKGLIEPTLNEWRESKGATWAKDYKEAEQIRLFHNSDELRAIRLANEHYARGVKLINRLTPEENAAAFRRAVDWYDADVTLEQAARELYSTPDELQNALGYARAQEKFLTKRLADLANDVAIPRLRWEQDFYEAYLLLEWWKKETR